MKIDEHDMIFIMIKIGKVYQAPAKVTNAKAESKK